MEYSVEHISLSPLVIIMPKEIDGSLCREVAVKSEEIGFEPSLVKRKNLEEVFRPDIRNNQKVNFFHKKMQVEVSKILDSRWLNHRPQLLPIKPTHVSTDHKVYKYDVGEYFNPHIDMQEERRKISELTLATVLVGLSDNYVGGETVFTDDELGSHKLGIGDIMIFQQMPDLGNKKTEHCSIPIISGSKYVFRTDLVTQRNFEEKYDW
jgi:hypothetical protein